MAPFSLVTAGVSWLAKSFTVFSCTSTLARCTRVLPTTYISSVKCLSTQGSGPPKRPLNGYMRYVLEQRPIVTKQNPDTRLMDISRKIAEQWRSLTPEQKRPFAEAYLRDKEQFKVDFQNYQDQLSPADVQQQALEKIQRMAKKKAIRKKKELTIHGKPKRPRSPFNIFMSEHFQEARGTTIQGKLKSLMDDWENLFSHQKQVYTQLAEDDKIRYKNEIKSWETQMLEIGREDLIREKTRSLKKRPKPKPEAKIGEKKAAKKAEAKTGEKATAAWKSTTTRKTTKSSKTV